MHLNLTPCVLIAEHQSSEQTDTWFHKQTPPPLKPGALFKPTKKKDYKQTKKNFKYKRNKSYLEARALEYDQPRDFSFVWLHSPPVEAQLVYERNEPH